MDTKQILPRQYASIVENLINFFDENAFDSINQVYYSEIDNYGKVVSKKVYTVALSRLTYGLSYTSAFYPENLTKAEMNVRFQLRHLIGKDSIGEYFIPLIDGTRTDIPESIDVWQQAYGLCGLTEYYRNRPSDTLLTRIHSLHDSFIKRFHDPVSGGFWGNYNLKTGPEKGSKSLQSLMYPLTAYMLNLLEADAAHSEKYINYITENLDIASKVAWNTENHWVNIKFDDTWKVCSNSDASNPCFLVSPGHNFQLAALMLRTKAFSFLSSEKKAKYDSLGNEILTETLNKKIFSDNLIEKGFYSQVNPLDETILDTRKTWWQHTEAIIALSFANNRFKTESERLQSFFFTNFRDYKYKGEYFYLDCNNNPVTAELKGSIGKSAYHTIEMLRFLFENDAPAERSFQP